MKVSVSQAMYVLIAILVMYLIYRRNQFRFDVENYVKRPASIDDILKMSENGLIKLYPYDLNYPRKYIFEKDGNYFKIKGEFPGTKKKYYFSVKDGNTFHLTSTAKPVGDVRWRLVGSVTGNDGYYSIASGDTETYLYLDITYGDGGVVDLSKEETVKGIDNPLSVNFTFTNPNDKATIAPIVKT